MTTIIELDGLEVTLGRHLILKGLSAELGGRCIGLLGPNGAGKTTLLNTLLGFYPPSAGGIRIFGHDVSRDALAIRKLTGFMPERDAFISGRTAVRFVRLMGELSGLPADKALERAHEALFYVGLGEARYRPMESYSLGMKQLAKLAQAIVHGPRLLLLDEPTAGLDPPARERMLEHIREIRERGDTHIILSSHLLRDVERCCDEVLVLKDGRIAVYRDLAEERQSNRSFIELEVRGAEEAFTTAIRELGIECAVSGNGRRPRRIKAVLPEDVAVRDLYRLAADREVQIRRLTYKRDSLEEIFLAAMEGTAIEPSRLAPPPAATSPEGSAE
ncbi:MAG: ABC transporter ATP-binding protein [Acidobacteriota bacterium]